MVSGGCSERARPRVSARRRSTASDLTTGTGGHQTRGATGSSLRFKAPMLTINDDKNTQGPCNRGKLFYLDPEAGGAGCYCRQEWEAYYWAPLDQCFEQESPGPCQEGQYFAYNATSRQTECNCFKNHVYSPSSRSCVELFTQGNIRVNPCVHVYRESLCQARVRPGWWLSRTPPPRSWPVTVAPTWPPTTGPPPGGVTPSTARGPASPGSSSGETKMRGWDYR